MNDIFAFLCHSLKKGLTGRQENFIVSVPDLFRIAEKDRSFSSSGFNP